MPRLRRADSSRPGLVRRRQGRGFRYEDARGRRVTDPDVLARIGTLVLPPAWTEVWICPYPNGHIQAIGTDAAGRRQYRYHDEWRRQRDRSKHESILDFARALPAARERVAEHLDERRLTRSRVLAGAVRLLDLGFFRIGSEEYAESNHTYGLATMRKSHVRIAGDEVVFSYLGKAGKERVHSIAEEPVRRLVTALRQRRGGGPELLAYRGPAGWTDVRSADINLFLRDLMGIEVSAKSFRTWHATVFAAVGLAVAEGTATSPTASKRAVAHVVREVAGYLGNTPAVCRSSYIDPRVIELFQDGITISDDLDSLGAGVAFGVPATQGAVEAAVIGLLQDAGAHRRVRRLPTTTTTTTKAAAAGDGPATSLLRAARRSA